MAGGKRAYSFSAEKTSSLGIPSPMGEVNAENLTERTARGWKGKYYEDCPECQGP
jgi:hypothetical protein